MGENNFTIYILSSIILMTLFGFSIIWFFLITKKKLIESELSEQLLLVDTQKKLISNTIQVTENERSRISRELHDDVSSQINIIKLKLHLLKKDKKATVQSKELVVEIESALQKSNTIIKTLTAELSSFTLNKFGYCIAMDDIKNAIERDGRFKLNITNCELINFRKKMANLHVYRISQELLNNAIKHSSATEVEISFKKNIDHILLKYQDDGVGLSKANLSKGFGMANLETRTNILNGQMEISNKTIKGLVITFKFPIND